MAQAPAGLVHALQPSSLAKGEQQVPALHAPLAQPASWVQGRPARSSSGGRTLLVAMAEGGAGAMGAALGEALAEAVALALLVPLATSAVSVRDRDW